MNLKAEYDPEADAVDVELYAGGWDAKTDKIAWLDDYRWIDLDACGRPCFLSILHPGRPGRLELASAAQEHGFDDRLLDVYKAIAQAIAASRQRAAA